MPQAEQKPHRQQYKGGGDGDDAPFAQASRNELADPGPGAAAEAMAMGVDRGSGGAERREDHAAQCASGEEEPAVHQKAIQVDDRRRAQREPERRERHACEGEEHVIREMCRRQKYCEHRQQQLQAHPPADCNAELVGMSQRQRQPQEQRRGIQGVERDVVNPMRQAQVRAASSAAGSG